MIHGMPVTPSLELSDHVIRIVSRKSVVSRCGIICKKEDFAVSQKPAGAKLPWILAIGGLVAGIILRASMVFVFHTPSEHRVGGVGSDLEVHFVHKNAKGSLAVVGVLVNELSGQENKAFKPIWDLLPRSFSATASTKVKVELSSLLPKSKTHTAPLAPGV
ncbi:hypothetical protein EBZ80_12140 [bacterium]|nr:hypothetical protein [bacterium]